jgi:Outer membrane protein beta-barrel domain
MRGFSKGIAAVALGVLLTAPALHAQGAEFTLGGGVGIPTGNFDNAVKTGWLGLVGVSFVPNQWPVGIQIDGQYQQYKFDGSASLKERFLIGTANIVFKFKTSEESKVRPYLIGGPGIYNFKATGTNDIGQLTTGGTTKFGFNAGAGFDFKAGSAGFFVEARYHNIFTSGADTKFIPIAAGFRFGGS